MGAVKFLVRVIENMQKVRPDGLTLGFVEQLKLLNAVVAQMRETKHKL